MPKHEYGYTHGKPHDTNKRGELMSENKKSSARAKVLSKRLEKLLNSNFKSKENIVNFIHVQVSRISNL